MAQLELALRFGRPVSIHCRKAWAAFLSVLKRFGRLPAGGIVHSYSGPPELIPELIGYNLSFSFSGSITRQGNKRGKKSLAAVPLERLLIETDSPDMPPEGVTGGSELAHLHLVAESIASFFCRPVDQIARVTSENAGRIFAPMEGTV